MWDGSEFKIVSRRSRSGQTTKNIIVENTTSLNSPLAKLTSASVENRRLNPASGEILLSLGLMGWVENTMRCWTILPAIPQIDISTIGIRTAANMLVAMA